MIRNMQLACAYMALLLAGAMSPASAETRAADIKIRNLTGFNTPSVQKWILADHPALGARLAAGKYALWAYVDSLKDANGKNYCVAFTGLTQQGNEDKNARVPTDRFMGVKRHASLGKLTDEERRDCRSEALSIAIGELGKGDWKSLTSGADRWTAEAGSRKHEPADPTLYQVSYLGVGGESDIETPADFSRAFDYRALQLVILAGALTLGDEAVCYASAGIARELPITGIRDSHLSVMPTWIPCP